MHPTTEQPLRLRPMEAGDWEAVARIYRQGIQTGQATLETEVPNFETWDAAHLEVPRLVAERSGRVVGWAALSPVSTRCVYQGVAEVSVYIEENARGQGIGRMLLERLISDSEDAGIWSLQARMFPENEASVRLHASLGFRRVGIRERLGSLDGIWRDVLEMERRSGRTGV